MAMQEEPKIEDPEIIPTEEPKKDKISIIDQIKNKINEKLDAGVIPNDKPSLIGLRKIVLDELKINKNNRGTVKTEIENIMVERKLSSTGLDFKSEKIDGINYSVDSPTPPDPSIQNQRLNQSQIQSLNTLGSPNNTQNIQKGGALPSTSGDQQDSPKKELTDAQIKSQERFFKKIFSFGAELMISTGFVETDDEEELKELEKPKPLKKFRKDMEDLGTEMSELTKSYGMELPKYLDLIAFAISALSVIAMPIILKVMMSDKPPQEKNFEKSFDDVEVNL